MRRIGAARGARCHTGAARWPRPAGACGGLVGENGTIQLTRTSTLAAYHDGVERYVTSFEFTGEGAEVGSIVPAARRAHEGRAGRRLDAPAARAGGARRRCRETLAVGGTARGARQGRGAAPDQDRRARHHHPARRRRRRRQVGARPRVPAHAGRAEGARLLLAAQPDLHGRSLRRHARHASSARRRATARRSCSPSRPTSRGCRCGSSALGLGPGPGRRRRRVPAHRRPARRCAPAVPASSWRAQRRGVERPARRPALRQGHGVGARRHVAQLPAGEHAGRRTSTTTSRCRPTPACCRRRGWWASASPVGRARTVVGGFPVWQVGGDRRRPARGAHRGRGRAPAPSGGAAS